MYGTPPTPQITIFIFLPSHVPFPLSLALFLFSVPKENNEQAMAPESASQTRHVVSVQNTSMAHACVLRPLCGDTYTSTISFFLNSSNDYSMSCIRENENGADYAWESSWFQKPCRNGTWLSVVLFRVKRSPIEHVATDRWNRALWARKGYKSLRAQPDFRRSLRWL